MKLTHEIALRNFRFWGGAKDVAARLTDEELDIIEKCLEDAHLLTDTEVNSYFWFDFDKDEGMLEKLGLTYEELYKREPDKNKRSYYYKLD